MRPSILLLAVAGLGACVLQSSAEAPAIENAPRLKWWREARFGMFIHWDMSSLAGTEISWSRKGSKPLDVTGDPAGYVEDPAYDNLYKSFNPVKFDAQAWVKLAKDAGMKYLVFTAKHHGGFCMWDTKLTDYSIMHTAFKRDVVGELADACHRAGLRFGLYYSPRDWHHPDYGKGDNHLYHEYLKGQLTELLTRYGKIDIMWFDSFGHGDSIQYWHADEILALVKRLQPQIVVNNRCSFFGQQVPSLAGDFDTPEQRLGSFQNTRGWESCLTLVHCPDGGGWSYRPDGTLRSFAECIGSLTSCATGDGNLLLDAGPNAQGEIPADQAARLLEIGQWLRKYGPSIYATRGGPYRNGRWGGSTYRGNTVYLHVANWDGDKLDLPALKSKVRKCSDLADPKAKPAIDQTAAGIRIALPAGSPRAVDTVIVLTLSAPAESELNHGKPIETAAPR